MRSSSSTSGYLSEMKTLTQKDICTPMFTQPYLWQPRYRNSLNLQCPLMPEWINCNVCVYTFIHIQTHIHKKWDIPAAACCCLIAKPCLTLCDPMDGSPPGPLSTEFFRQEYWSGLQFPFLGDLPDPGNKPTSAQQVDSLLLSHLGSPNGILFRHKKDWHLAIYNNINVLWGHYAKWNTSDRERQIHSNLSYMWSQKQTNKKQSHTILVVARGGW